MPEALFDHTRLDDTRQMTCVAKRSQSKVAPLVVGLQSQPDIRALRHSTALVWINAEAQWQ